MKKLEIIQEVYPSGAPYTRMKLGYALIGIYSQVDGGFLVNGCRKPVATEREAQSKAIQRYVKEHIKLAAEAARLLEQY